MHDVPILTSCRDSDDLVDTEQGSKVAELCFQHDNSGDDAWVELKGGGAFRCGAYPETCDLQMRVDKGEPFDQDGTLPAGGDDPREVKILLPDNMLNELGAGSRLLIALPIKGEATQNIAFTLTGLDVARLHMTPTSNPAP